MACSKRTVSPRSGLLAAAAVSLVVSLAAVPGLLAQEPEARVGEQAPRFFLPQLDGDEFRLSNYVGLDSRWQRRSKQVVVLSFFATWCVPCREELPALQVLSRAFAGQQVQWKLVNVRDQPDTTRRFLRRLGVDMPVLMDRYGKVYPRYCTGLPTLVVIDRDGVVRYLRAGYGDQDRDAMKRVAVAVSEGLGVPVPPGWQPSPAAGDTTMSDAPRGDGQPPHGGRD